MSLSEVSARKTSLYVSFVLTANSLFNLVHKPRIVQKTEVTKYQAKEVFKEFKDDSTEVLTQTLNSDNKMIKYTEVCDGDVQDAKKTEDKVRE